MSVLSWLRSVLVDDQRDALALVDGQEAQERAAARAVLERPDFDTECLLFDGEYAIVLGKAIAATGRPFTLQLGEGEVREGGHWLVTGATGSGKSYWAVSALLQLLRHRPSGVVVLDMKGELASDLRKVWLPALVASLPDERARDLARRIAVIAPFDRDAVPPFQVLARDRSLPIELQARDVASSFGHTLGRDLGVLQTTILTYAILLAIDVGLALPDVPGLLSEPERLRAAVERTTLPEVRAYFANRFPRERSGSLVSLLSRLDTLLMHPSLRDMLAAPGMIRFDRLIDDAITIIDLGGAPAGIRELATFLGSVIFTKLVRAVFARRVGRGTRPVTIIADEFQSLLSPEVAGDFEAILTKARSQKAFLWMLCQQTAQVEAASSTLLRIIKTNTNYQLLFRANEEDARALDYIFPVTGRVPRDAHASSDPRTPRVMLSESDERRRIVETVPSMPGRTFWFWNRRRPYRALLAQSPAISIERARRDAGGLPPELAAAISRGVLTAPHDELRGRPAPTVTATQRETGTTPTTGVPVEDEVAFASTVQPTAHARDDETVGTAPVREGAAPMISERPPAARRGRGARRPHLG